MDGNEIDNFKSSWEYKALKLQRTIDLTAPLSSATFIATHNSFNASAYSSMVRYIDPNQKYSLYDQLEMGVREIELDVHKYFSMKGWPWHWKTKLLLSHGQDNHVGASAFDREFSEGLAEIEDWIRKNENKEELLIIDIEDHMDGKYSMAVDEIEAYLGDLVYRPVGGRQGLSMGLSKSDILASGKQIVIISDKPNYEWNLWVFKGVGDKDHFYQDKPQNYYNYPLCSNEFSREIFNNYMVRCYEDRTNLSAMFSDPGDPITVEKVSQLVKCGVNIISMDKLKPWDGRLQSAIWSWDFNEPNNWNNNEDYAVQKANGRFNDLNDDAVYKYACKNSDSGDWYVTDASGNWENGESSCYNETDGQFHFSVPVNGYENEKLKDAKIDKDVAVVWLNYHDANVEGEWESDTSFTLQNVVENKTEDDAYTTEGTLSQKSRMSMNQTLEMSAVGGCGTAANASTGQNGVSSYSAKVAGLINLLFMMLFPFLLVSLKRKFNRR